MSDYATNMSKSIAHTTKRLTEMINEVRQKQAQAERDEIIRMVREACDPDTVDAWKNGFWILTQEELERFAALVAEAEREACAKLCNEADKSTHPADLATDIRARGGEMTPSEKVATVLLVVCLIAFHILLVVL
jgi:hypothetical protein